MVTWVPSESQQPPPTPASSSGQDHHDFCLIYLTSSYSIFKGHSIFTMGGIQGHLSPLPELYYLKCFHAFQIHVPNSDCSAPMLASSLMPLFPSPHTSNSCQSHPEVGLGSGHPHCHLPSPASSTACLYDSSALNGLPAPPASLQSSPNPTASASDPSENHIRAPRPRLQGPPVPLRTEAQVFMTHLLQSPPLTSQTSSPIGPLPSSPPPRALITFLPQEPHGFLPHLFQVFVHTSPYH